ncbi:MAG: O-antigen ligase family protein [Patescibacteria group bacterium]|nr:O-antigen ligase family protein [Patescibacteria group bacterium]
MFIESLYLKVLNLFLPLFVVTLPLANRDIFSIFISRIFPSRLIIVVIIALSGVCLFWSYLKSSGKKAWLRGLWDELRKDFLLKLLLALLVIRIISIKNSLNLKASLDLLLFYLSVIALYLILKFIYNKRPSFISRLFKLHVITVSLIAVYGLVQIILSFFAVRLPGVLVGSTFVRIPATFYDANHLPPYLLTAFPVVLIYFFYARKDWQKLALAVLLGIYAVVTLFTFSRSGFISFVVALTILGLVFVWRRYTKKILFMFAVAALSAVVIFVSSQTQLSIFKRLTSVFDLEDKSTVAHGLLIYGGLTLARQNPIIGLGYGSFSEHFRDSAIGRQQAFFDPATQVRIPAHSIWLETLVETGVVGFALYLWVILEVLEKGLWALRRLKNKRLFLEHLAVYASLLGILTGGLFYSYNLEFFWFFVFYVFFQSRFWLEADPKAFAETENDEALKDEERVDWGFLGYVVILLLIGVSVIFAGQKLIPILPGREGFLATVGKYIRQSWGYATLGWWKPVYGSKLVLQPPLPFWLNAFWTYIYDFGSTVPRFFPSLFGLAAILVTYINAQNRRGARFAFFASALLLALPLVIFGLRFGDIYGYVLFFSALNIYFLRLIFDGDKKFLMIPQVLALAVFSLISYSGFLLLLVADVFYILIRARLKKDSSFWLVLPLFLSFAPLLAWWQILYHLTPVTLLDLFKNYSEWNYELFYFLAAAPLSLWLASILYRRYKTLIFAFLCFLVIFWFFRAGTYRGNIWQTDLIKERLSLSRDGRVPTYLLAPPGSDDFYYSEVPLYGLSLSKLSEKLGSQEHFFAILPGATLVRLRESGINSFYVRFIEGSLALIEKPGRL